jgi:hypothetical protein
VHDNEESPSVLRPAHLEGQVGAAAFPAHPQKPQKQADSAQGLPDPKAISLPGPQPSPATVPHIASPIPHNPTSASAPQTLQPTATSKIASRAVNAGPTTGQVKVPQEDEPAESTTEDKPAKLSMPGQGISGEHADLNATNTPASASAKQSPVSPAPGPSQVRNKSANPVEAQASEHRIQVENDKETDEELGLPATSFQATPLPAPPSPTVGIEPIKPEAWHSAEHKPIVKESSLTSNVQAGAGQPQAVKPDLSTTIVSPAERPVVFAPPHTFLPIGGETAVQEASSPSQLAAQRAGLIDRAMDDPGLSLNVMPHSAHLSIAGETGNLALHVRVRDGSADVNVSGTMAPLFDAKAGEVRSVLAGEGLQMGSFATDQRGNSQSQQGQPESAPRTHDLPPPPPRRTNPSTSEAQITDDRRIHVTA